MNTFFLPKQGAHLFYHDFPGERPALVYLHGLGSSSSSFFPRCARHTRLRDHRSILIDLLGYGYSDRPESYSYSMEEQAETVASLLESLGLKNTALIGHSMGGSIAILLAHDRLDLISRLIVAEGNLDPGPGFVSGRITSMSERTFVDEGYERFMSGMTSAGYHDYAGTVRAADPVGLHRSATDLIADRTPTYREMFYQLEIPRTYIFGEKSLPDPDEVALRSSDIDVRIVANAGHDMMGDNPDGFALAIANAIDAITLLH
ncbi:alpha/beta fold hydrolase [Candidatus Bipolaricaulota bacterium]